MHVLNAIHPSSYRDSVSLMQLARELERRPGLRRAAVMMGTPSNLDLMREAGVLGAGGEGATATDLVIAVLADDEGAARTALAAAEAALRAAPQRSPTAGPRPRSLAAALGADPEASLALVSVPGDWAGAEARRALQAGLSVLLFSDNVDLDTEIELKREAAARGLLLMGPDCGTAILNGVPLGFANAVPRGRVGIAAASGTGAQEVSCLVAALGEGVSHVIGVGGRDLSAPVGGRMMDRALELLEADPRTEVVCMVGKPPDPEVLERLASRVASMRTPCVARFVGAGPGGPSRPWHVAATLEDAAVAAVALARGQARKKTRPRTGGMMAPDAMDAARGGWARRAPIERLARGMAPGQRFVRGLFAGGTLAHEARELLAGALAGVAPGLDGQGAGHRVVDLGGDAFTRGRPHPMIDGAIRREWIEREAANPAVAVLLLDVVLGHGASADPAGEVLPAIARAQAEARAGRRALAVVASVVGTDADPQPRRAQVARLEAGGVVVMPSAAQAARLAARVAARLARR